MVDLSYRSSGLCYQQGAEDTSLKRKQRNPTGPRVLSVVAKYCSAARDAQEGRWRKLNEAARRERQVGGVCVWKQGCGCNSENLFNSHTAICTL